MATTTSKRPWLLAAASAALTTVAACGGGSDAEVAASRAMSAQAASSDPSAAQPRHALALVDERNADGTHSLFLVDTLRDDRASRRLLDHESLSSYEGRIVGDRVIFSRTVAVAPGTGNPLDADLYSVGLDGAGLTQLTSGPALDELQGIVGERVVFNRRFGSPQSPVNQDVMSIRLDGTELRPLANNPARAESASRLVGDVVLVHSRLITSDFNQSNPDLYAVKADGSTAAAPIATSQAAEFFQAMVGEQVVFAHNIPGPNGWTLHRLYSRSLTDGAFNVLADAPDQDHRYVGHIGERVFISARKVTAAGAGPEFISSVNADGSDKIPVLVPNAYLQTVLGDRLIFSREWEGVQLFSVAASGQDDRTQLTFASQPSTVVGVAGETLIIDRAQPSGSILLRDLHALHLGPTGAQEVPLATNADSEYYEGTAAGRVLFTRWLPPNRRELYSVALDGAGLLRLLADSPGSEFVEAVRGSRRVIVRRSMTPGGGPNALEQLVAVNIDGSNPVVLSNTRSSVELVDR
jgi:hypothetical protein